MAEILAETERLILRREVAGDQAVWLEHMSTPEVMDHLGGPQSAEQIAQGFAAMAAAADEGRPGFVLVALKSDGMLIGKCGLGPIKTEAAPPGLRGQLEVGWTLRADQWGKGYAREAAEAALALAFDRYGVTTVYSQTSERNAPSWRLMERLGMRRRADLGYVDPAYKARDNPTVVYSLDATEWSARNDV